MSGRIEQLINLIQLNVEENTFAPRYEELVRICSGLSEGYIRIQSGVQGAAHNKPDLAIYDSTNPEEHGPGRARILMEVKTGRWPLDKIKKDFEGTGPKGRDPQLYRYQHTPGVEWLYFGDQYALRRWRVGAKFEDHVTLPLHVLSEDDQARLSFFEPLFPENVGIHHRLAKFISSGVLTANTLPSRDHLQRAIFATTHCIERGAVKAISNIQNSLHEADKEAKKAAEELEERGDFVPRHRYIGVDINTRSLDWLKPHPTDIWDTSHYYKKLVAIQPAVNVFLDIVPLALSRLGLASLSDPALPKRIGRELADILVHRLLYLCLYDSTRTEGQSLLNAILSYHLSGGQPLGQEVTRLAITLGATAYELDELINLIGKDLDESIEEALYHLSPLDFTSIREEHWPEAKCESPSPEFWEEVDHTPVDLTQEVVFDPQCGRGDVLVRVFEQSCMRIRRERGVLSSAPSAWLDSITQALGNLVGYNRQTVGVETTRLRLLTLAIQDIGHGHRRNAFKAMVPQLKVKLGDPSTPCLSTGSKRTYIITNLVDTRIQDDPTLRDVRKSSEHTKGMVNTAALYVERVISDTNPWHNGQGEWIIEGPLSILRAASSAGLRPVLMSKTTIIHKLHHCRRAVVCGDLRSATGDVRVFSRGVECFLSRTSERLFDDDVLGVLPPERRGKRPSMQGICFQPFEFGDDEKTDRFKKLMESRRENYSVEGKLCVYSASSRRGCWEYDLNKHLYVSTYNELRSFDPKFMAYVKPNVSYDLDGEVPFREVREGSVLHLCHKSLSIPVNSEIGAYAFSFIRTDKIMSVTPHPPKGMLGNGLYVILFPKRFPFHYYMLSRVMQYIAISKYAKGEKPDKTITWSKCLNLMDVPLGIEAELLQLGEVLHNCDLDIVDAYREVDPLFTHKLRDHMVPSLRGGSGCLEPGTLATEGPVLRQQHGSISVDDPRYVALIKHSTENLLKNPTDVWSLPMPSVEMVDVAYAALQRVRCRESAEKAMEAAQLDLDTLTADVNGLDREKVHMVIDWFGSNKYRLPYLKNNDRGLRRNRCR